MFQNNSLTERVSTGMDLAKGKWKHLCEDLIAKDERRAATTAFLLENTWKFYNNMTEDTKVANVGVFDKFAMPIIRAVFPNLVATDLVSVQPMDGPTSLVFFLEARYALTKGSVTAGQTAFSALSGKDSNYAYTSENIDAEQVGDGDGTETDFTGTLTWTPVRPGSVRVTAAGILGLDTGNGTIVGTGIAAGSTINYTNGSIAVNFSVAPANGVDIMVSYDFNSEGNSDLPQLDLQISHSPVHARPHKVKARWSVEGLQDLKNIHSLDMEAELMAFLGEQLRYDIDRGIIADMLAIADSTVSPWSQTPAAGVADVFHRQTFVYTLIEASNLIFKRTRRGTANWIVCDTNVASIIESLPNFKPSSVSGSGVVYMGTLNGRWDVYKDPYMTVDTALLGYKGTNLVDAGYVYAPYVPLYRTPTIYLDDMVGRIGLMSRYGKRVINKDFFTKVTITA